MPLSTLGSAWAAILFAVEIAGIASAGHAVMNVRSSQGAIAWTIALLSFPLLALPLYWIFGRNRFHGYVELLRDARSASAGFEREACDSLAQHAARWDDGHPVEHALDRLTRRHFTLGNRVRLLVDGEATFASIFEAIDAATRYVLVQSYILRHDRVGEELRRHLALAARRGARVLVLYDEIGCHALGRGHLRSWTDGGIVLSPFRTTRGPANRFQINFRNHRKLVVADGRVALVGGHNFGDEYLGQNPRFGHWRDTHVRIEGPAVQAVQAAFVEDWFWATETVPALEWSATPATGAGVPVLPLATGPADPIHACTLFFLAAIHGARRRLWIASPYFVPDESVCDALKLAALRGVDVRIMIAGQADHLLVYLAGFSYLEEMDAAGVRLYRYHDGFLHQKVLLMDDALACVGTANLDNRSLHLNFEIGAVVSDPAFAAEIASMLERDFTGCLPAGARDITTRPLPFRVAVRAARLLAPVL